MSVLITQVLREAKDVAEVKAKENEEFEEARKAHFGAQFDEFQGRRPFVKCAKLLQIFKHLTVIKLTVIQKRTSWKILRRHTLVAFPDFLVCYKNRISPFPDFLVCYKNRISPFPDFLVCYKNRISQS